MPRYSKPTKICRGCGLELPTETFSRRRKRSRNGKYYMFIRNVCAPCHQIAARSYHVAAPRRPCAVCGKPAAKVNGDYCSDVCFKAARKVRSAAKHKATYQPSQREPRVRWRDLPEAECNICHKVKSISEYYRGAAGRRCKECERQKSTEYRRCHPEIVAREKERLFKWKTDNPERAKEAQRLLHRQHQRARDAKKQFPHIVSSRDWRQAREAFGDMCVYCDTPVAKPEMDHFVPLARDGQNTKYNVVPACRPCNMKKNAKEPRMFINDEDRYQFICDTLGSL